MKVAVPPAATGAEAGETANQPVPLLMVAVGVTVTAPVQAPTTPMVKVCAAGFAPTGALKASLATDGGCKVQTGRTVSVTVTTWGRPICRCVILSVAVMVMLPLYVPATRPVLTIPIVASEGATRVTVPAAGVTVSHVPPAGTVARAALQLKAWTQAPAALIVIGCGAGAG